MARNNEDIRSPYAAIVHTPRKCLMCDRVFNSEGRQNRICHPCKHQDVFRGIHNIGRIPEGRGAVGQ